MRIETLILGELKTNCYLLIERDRCLLIDPADSADFILEKIVRENLTLMGILATHGHFDHILCVGEIQLSLPVPLYIDKNDDFLVKRLNKTAAHFLGYDPTAVEPLKKTYFPDGDEDIGMDPFSFRLIHVPGHTPGSVAFYFPREQAIFTGDTLFKDAIGRTDLSYSDKKELRNSLAKLWKLPEETFVYSGHGEETTIGESAPLRELFAH